MMTFSRLCARAFLFSFCIGFICSINLPAFADNGLERIVFLRPDKERGSFWNLFEDVLRAACDDLDITLDVAYAESDPLLKVQVARDIAGKDDKPDLVLLQIDGRTGFQILNIFEDAGIDNFIVNTTFDDQHIQKAGRPRENFKHWIGQMTPDDEEAGRLVADFLYQKAKHKKLLMNDNVHMVAIDGVSHTRASQERMRGLSGAIALYDDLILDGTIEGRWQPHLAKEATQRIMQRYPRANVVWSISDQTAIGAYDALIDLGKKPGQDILVAGIDWAPEIFDYIRDGRIEGSLGGHFMEGAWAVIMAYDYKNGHDFAAVDGLVMQSHMQIIDRDNVDALAPLLENADWDALDFKAMTKTHNPALARYEFDALETLLTLEP